MILSGLSRTKIYLFIYDCPVVLFVLAYVSGLTSASRAEITARTLK